MSRLASCAPSWRACALPRSVSHRLRTTVGLGLIDCEERPFGRSLNREAPTDWSHDRDGGTGVPSRVTTRPQRMDLVGVEPTPLGLKARLAPTRPGPSIPDPARLPSVCDRPACSTLGGRHRSTGGSHRPRDRDPRPDRWRINQRGDRRALGDQPADCEVTRLADPHEDGRPRPDPTGGHGLREPARRPRRSTSRVTTVLVSWGPCPSGPSTQS
jgi:hypothetical protein